MLKLYVAKQGRNQKKKKSNSLSGREGEVKSHLHLKFKYTYQFFFKKCNFLGKCVYLGEAVPWLRSCSRALLENSNNIKIVYLYLLFNQVIMENKSK